MGRWLMIAMWTVVALSVSLVACATLYVWLLVLTARPGASSLSSDWLFYLLAVVLPAICTLAVFIRGVRGRMPGTVRHTKS